MRKKTPVVLVTVSPEGFEKVTEELFSTTEEARKWARAHRSSILEQEVFCVRVVAGFRITREEIFRTENIDVTTEGGNP